MIDFSNVYSFETSAVSFLLFIYIIQPFFLKDQAHLFSETPAKASVPFAIFDENSQMKKEKSRIPVYEDQTDRENRPPLPIQDRCVTMK